jgi:hypothetical protein
VAPSAYQACRAATCDRLVLTKKAPAQATDAGASRTTGEKGTVFAVPQAQRLKALGGFDPALEQRLADKKRASAVTGVPGLKEVRDRSSHKPNASRPLAVSP